MEAILPTDPGQDGIAIGLDGKVYSDTAITDAVARVGELGPPGTPKVAVCHFPPQERAQFQVRRVALVVAAGTFQHFLEPMHSCEGSHLGDSPDLGRRPWMGSITGALLWSQVKYLEVVPTVAAQLVKKGDFPGAQIPKEEVCLRVHPVRPCVRLLHRG